MVRFQLKRLKNVWYMLVLVNLTLDVNFTYKEYNSSDYLCDTLSKIFLDGDLWKSDMLS